MRVSTTDKAMRRATAIAPPSLTVLGWVEDASVEGALVRNAMGLIYGWTGNGEMFSLDQAEVYFRLHQSRAGKRPKRFSAAEIARRTDLLMDAARKRRENENKKTT